MDIDVDDLSMIEISADGPLSLTCDACHVQIYGTAYPVTFIVLSHAIRLAQQHVREAHGRPHPTGSWLHRAIEARREHLRPDITDGEPITERAVFTQRDVDPLGRGNATQHEGGGVCGAWQPPHPGLVPYMCSMDVGHDGAHRAYAFGGLVAGWPNVQAPDLQKCDESSLRSDGS